MLLYFFHQGKVVIIYSQFNRLNFFCYELILITILGQAIVVLQQLDGTFTSQKLTIMISDELFRLTFPKAHNRDSLLRSRRIYYLIYSILGLY